MSRLTKAQINVRIEELGELISKLQIKIATRDVKTKEFQMSLALLEASKEVFEQLLEK